MVRNSLLYVARVLLCYYRVPQFTCKHIGSVLRNDVPLKGGSGGVLTMAN